MSQAIACLVHHLTTSSTRLLALACTLLVLGAAPGVWAKDKSAPAGIEAKARSNQPVEVLVLLDDASIQAAETGDTGTYKERMKGRQLRLDSLKTRVAADLSGSGVETLGSYSVLPVMHLRISSGKALDKLLQNQTILSIDENSRNEKFLAQSLPLIEQPTAWDSGNGFGGSGATVAILDTGVDYTRSAFGSCTSPGVPAGDCKVVYAADIAPDDGSLDDDSHGTNVAGIALGVAPAANIAALDVFRTDGYAYTSDLIAAIDWCVANKAAYNIASINMSLGSGRYATPVSPTDSWGTSIQRAVDAGILVAAASGNNAYTRYLSLPAAYSNTVSVGAVYDANLGSIRWSVCSDTTTAADKVTCFSNSASFLSMLAPGSIITAAGISMSGTSQATPHVAGAAAVLRAAFPTDTVQQTLERLQLGPLVTDSRNGISKPRLDLVASLAGASTEPPSPPDPGVTQYLQLGSAAYSVAESGGSVSIPVVRTGDTTGTVSVQYATVSGTAAATADYTAKSGTLSFAAGVSSQTISIPIINDTIAESTESFQLLLSNPSGAVLGDIASATVTITDDDKNATFPSGSASVNEGDGSITLLVKRLGDASSTASVKYATANGTARSKSDYTSKSGTLTWAAGDSADKAIVIPIINNTTKEYSEYFYVRLSSPIGLTLGSYSSVTVIITDND